MSYVYLLQQDKTTVRGRPKAVYITTGGRKRKEEMIWTGCCISGHKVGSVSHSIRHACLQSNARNCLCEGTGSTFQSYLVQCVLKGCSERSWNDTLNGEAHHVRWKINPPLCYWITMNNLSKVLRSLEISSTTLLKKQHSVHFHSPKELKSHNFFWKECYQKLGNWWGF